MDLKNFYIYTEELFRKLRNIIISFFIIFILFLFFGLKKGSIYGISFFYPYPDFTNSIAINFFNILKSQLLPKGIVLLNIGPFDALIVIIYTSISMSLALNVPFILYEMLSFISPALYKKEKKILLYSIFPGTVLFVLGFLFAFFIILPLLFHMVLIFARNMGVLPTIGVRNFASIIFLILVGVGLAFETPIIMVSLTYLKIVKPEIWFKNWRYAIIVSFFIALLISPGATGGILEITIALIILLLYIMGAIISKIIYKP